MNKYFSTLGIVLMALSLALISCNDDDDPTIEGGKYIILNAQEKFGAGYITSYDEFPSGDTEEITNQSLQTSTAFGFRSFGSWIFVRANPAGDAGLQKFIVNEDGSLAVGGFIANASQFLVVDETTGFYLDENRSTLKIQTFNPSTMQRTGDIDLTSLKDETVEYQVIGKHTLAAKEGKLYAGVTYGTTARGGFGDDVVDYIEFAVIDIATGSLDKTIKYEQGGLKSIGWGSSGNKMWTLGDDGALYFYSTGIGVAFEASSIIRIKAGETDFDANWRLNATDLGSQSKSSIATGLVKNGKIYIELASEDLSGDFANLQDDIFEYYTVDINTLQATKITGMPMHHYAYGNEQCITEVDGKLLFWVRNVADNIDAYYSLNSDGVSATQEFNLAHDGFMWGFVKLTD
ncbi:hypothetical protein N7E81_14980 [Reichenbachiella carrageenanivorans]|uniref:DUF4374 domain-containing protein n=1 Tax=Reichenbachiella carrageenanivorans TaxID=2979869 RepID=A0ABY6D0S2_9BACT|nr:hypothetical protein [Reichenbachiella carrageenanivorans]UXX78663.1 hypothetical protein N7E81_14980 [Reichenbachiella carrageenanivorans]